MAKSGQDCYRFLNGICEQIEALNKVEIFTLMTLQNRIEQNHINNSRELFDMVKEDVRLRAFNYKNPYCSKTINGVEYRITDGFGKSYLLYANGVAVGEYQSIKAAKTAVSFLN